MTDASARARAILDAIERDAAERQATLGDAQLLSSPAPAVLLHEPAAQAQAPAALAAPAPPPPPAFTLPPMPAVASPIVALAPLSAPTAPAHDLPAGLQAHVMAPVVPETLAPTRPAPASAAEPPTHEAARLLALVDHVVEQTKHAQQRLHTLDAAVTALSRRLGVEGQVDAAAEPFASPEPATVAIPDVAVSERLEPPVPAEALHTATPVAARPPAARTDGARLVAIEMAVGGFSRGEVQDRLVREYGLREPRTILDDVFGADSGADSRMPWGAV